MNKDEYDDNIINIYQLLKTLKDSGIIRDFKINNSFETKSVSISVIPEKIFPEKIDVSVNIVKNEED